MCFYFLVLVRQWLIGGLVPGDWIPLWKGLLLNGTLRIPNHWAPNHQETISWACTYLESWFIKGFFAFFAYFVLNKHCCWRPETTSISLWVGEKKASAPLCGGKKPSHSFGEILSSVSLHKNLYRQIHSSISHRRDNFCIIFIVKVCRFSRTFRIAWTKKWQCLFENSLRSFAPTVPGSHCWIALKDIISTWRQVLHRVLDGCLFRCGRQSHRPCLAHTFLDSQTADVV